MDSYLTKVDEFSRTETYCLPPIDCLMTPHHEDVSEDSFEMMSASQLDRANMILEIISPHQEEISKDSFDTMSPSQLDRADMVFEIIPPSRVESIVCAHDEMSLMSLNSSLEEILMQPLTPMLDSANIIMPIDGPIESCLELKEAKTPEHNTTPLSSPSHNTEFGVYELPIESIESAFTYGSPGQNWIEIAGEEKLLIEPVMDDSPGQNRIEVADEEKILVEAVTDDSPEQNWIDIESDEKLKQRTFVDVQKYCTPDIMKLIMAKENSEYTLEPIVRRRKKRKIVFSRRKQRGMYKPREKKIDSSELMSNVSPERDALKTVVRKSKPKPKKAAAAARSPANGGYNTRSRAAFYREAGIQQDK